MSDYQHSLVLDAPHRQSMPRSSLTLHGCAHRRQPTHAQACQDHFIYVVEAYCHKA